jgi:lipoate-protein ligase B
LERQKELVERRRRGEAPDTLVLTEHEPVFTVGRRRGAEAHLLWTEEECRRRGFDFVRTNRGGDITYHGPGQVVGYPVVSLAGRRDLHGYLRALEDLVIRVVDAFGIRAGRREGKTGIWIDDRKICAIGVAVRSWVTYHGFALNLCPDLSHFEGIVPCGITDGSVTSMERELGRPVAMDEVKPRIAVEFARLFPDTPPTDG